MCSTDKTIALQRIVWVLPLATYFPGRGGRWMLCRNAMDHGRGSTLGKVNLPQAVVDHHAPKLRMLAGYCKGTCWMHQQRELAAQWSWVEQLASAHIHARTHTERESCVWLCPFLPTILLRSCYFAPFIKCIRCRAPLPSCNHGFCAGHCFVAGALSTSSTANNKCSRRPNRKRSGWDSLHLSRWLECAQMVLHIFGVFFFATFNKRINEYFYVFKWNSLSVSSLI